MNDLGNKRSPNPGFKVGLIGGMIMALINLVVFFVNGADTRGDFLVWIVQVLSYFLLGRMAANRQADLQRYTYEPTRGIVGAGVGAALTTSVLFWLYIILRGLVRDAFGVFIVMYPIQFAGWIMVDVTLALMIGAFAGRSVLRHNAIDNDIDF